MIPIVELVLPNLEDEERIIQLHGSSVEVTISTTTFIMDRDIATI